MNVRPSSPVVTVALAVAASAVVAIAACTTNTEKPATAAPLTRFTAAPGDTLKEPVVVRSVPIPGKNFGLIDATVEVVLDSTNVPGSGNMEMRSYKLVAANGKTYNNIGFPGPTFRAHVGDSVRILLVNKLPADPSPHACVKYAATDTTPPRDTFPNCFHGPNTTNTHYHGFHITPSDSGDNVLIEVAPGTSRQTAFRIPSNQSPGTMWYHPHKHGSVALQVTNGMSGAFIIDGGGLDSLTQSLNMKEHLIGVQQVDSQVSLVSGANKSGTKLVDGQLNPIIDMRPGEVQRWRLVNENVSKTTTYAIVFADTGVAAPTMFDVARDGVQYAPENYDAVHPDSQLIVAPGNRLDLFVKAPLKPGLHKLNARLVGRVGPRAALLQGGATAAATQALLTVRVVADTVKVNTTLPASIPALPAFLANLPTTKDTSAFLMFSETGGPGGGANPPNFFLGTNASPNQKFNPQAAFLKLPLGVTQTWKVSSLSANANHPFHIHINPFQVLKVVYNTGDANKPFYDELNAWAAKGHPLWMDTFALPLVDATGKIPGYVVIRQRYDDFAGSFVMHCHILGHEERGMMQLLTVVPAGTTTANDGKKAKH